MRADAKQFVAFAKATAGGTLSRLVGIVRLAFTFGPSETMRMLRNIAAGRGRKIGSLALETFWSRGAIRWGETLAVRYLLRPAPGAAPAPQPSATDPEYPFERICAPPRCRRDPLRALHPTLCRCDIDTDRGYGDRMDRARLAARQGRRPCHIEAGLRHGRGVHQCAGDRRACFQSVEHDRRVPPARQSEPRPQGRL